MELALREFLRESRFHFRSNIPYGKFKISTALTTGLPSVEISSWKEEAYLLMTYIIQLYRRRKDGREGFVAHT